MRSVGKTMRPEDPVGTLRDRSPEQLIRSSGCYGPEVDIWALGCVMAELLTGGEPLFTATTEEDMITMGVEAFHGMVELSVAGREVLAGLLAFHSEERLTAADALKHRRRRMRRRCPLRLPKRSSLALCRRSLKRRRVQ